MAYLLDTCSISEFVSKAPNPKAVDGLIALPREQIHLSVITVGELDQGITELKEGKGKTFLRTWLDDHVLVIYAQRLLPLDLTVVREWGRLNAGLKHRGFTMQIKDSLIAATALTHDLAVVTRNEADFAHCGVRVFNPWK